MEIRAFLPKMPAAHEQGEERAGNYGPAPCPPALKLPEEFTRVQKCKQTVCAYRKTQEMGFLLLSLSACLISHTWLLSPVPFPPNAHPVNLSSCLCAWTLHVPESSVSASSGHLGEHAASQNMVNISFLCHTFPLFWRKRDTRAALFCKFAYLVNFLVFAFSIFLWITSSKIIYQHGKG